MTETLFRTYNLIYTVQKCDKSSKGGTMSDKLHRNTLVIDQQWTIH